ncbi:uncharacterized protein YgbK (DUF1537 family) [Sinobaca qinghaiensis]|uniref:Uncharacterized protein YgbK (DUF1537 family) n=1 Tax=Sinobaca qinghaiensis TaxID=342944 RepID=A0A419V4N7_9BACL|nr:four-carbon acid sugar kinase family protein [Sinobaca qinghaiensis]RKD73488.1 uncharacterized protein YgbK (DUF1537 family) [Sinobaca qinghaiensis]
MKVLDYHDMQNSFEPINEEKINTLWKAERASFSHQIIVLDDDPTGVQAVHGVSVYTDWTKEIIEEGFEETGNIFFILTNSRALDSKETEHLHKTIAERIERVSAQKKVPYLIISRGDSTLRGHYPLETEVLKDTLEKQTDSKVDGEIILPYFKQGGRLTIDNVHYVKQGEKLIPAGKTEFAEDRTFGFTSSHLGEWVQEKTEGRYKKDKAIYISLASLRGLQIEAITDQLLAVQNFNKVIVNAVEEADVRVFTIALMRALRQNKKFLYRTAATFTKIIGDISEKALLEKKDLLSAESQKGGLIVIGSHVKKTTQQLEALMELGDLRFIHFDSHLIVEPEVFQKEVESVQKQVDDGLKEGITTVVYTNRERLDMGEGRKEEELKQSVRISDALTSIVRNAASSPAYILAKGGITSSDVGTKGLGVRKATVKGQIAPGIPVWETKEESLFPYIPYIIFPGNVGEIDTMKKIVMMLEQS